MDETPEPHSLTDPDLDRIQSRATEMVGFRGLGGREEPLTWEQVRHWDAISAQDGLSLVAEVRRLRSEVVELVEVIERAAVRLATTNTPRHQIAAWLTSHIEGDHVMVVDREVVMRSPGYDQQDNDSRPTGIPDLVDVTDVRVLARYLVELTFDDGQVRVIDLEPHLWGEAFSPLVADYELFCQVAVEPEAGTIVWPTGADLSAEMLYARSRPVTPGAQEDEE